MNELFVDNNKFCLVEEDLKNAFFKIRDSLPSTDDEKDLSDTFLKIVSDYFTKFNIDLFPNIRQQERNIGFVQIEGQHDALIGFIVIEFKRYGLLASEGEFQSAKKQLKDQYLNPIPESQKKNYYGIIFDGVTYAKLHYNPTIRDWDTNRAIFDISSLKDILFLISGSTKKLISKNSIVEDFNIDSPKTAEIIATIYGILNEAIDNNEIVRDLFDEWDTNFSHIYGGVLNEDRIKSDFQAIADKIISDEIEPKRFLFSLYTYYAFIVKLIAAESLTINSNIECTSILGKILNSKNIRDDLEFIENGSLFHQLFRIENYIEGDYFSWYLYAWDKNLEKVIRNTLNLLNQYDLRSFELEIKQSRDLLKVLYQEIIPSTIRHDLGEFYTPDWLIQLTIDEAKYFGDQSKRLLDPGCGSGGFLIESIRRLRAAAESGIDSTELLRRILNNIYGMDVNPVAVLTARTNYLMVISDLVADPDRPKIVIPVFMSDSVITPTTEGSGKIIGTHYKFSTTNAGLLEIPSVLIDQGIFVEIVSVLETMKNRPTREVIEKIKQNSWFEEYREEILTFLEELEKIPIEIRVVWVRLMLNSLAPLFIGEFDFVIGNPPWIKWDFLSKDYKEKLAILYLKVYKLFSHSGMKASLGFAHDDISIVFTYVVLDKYLKMGGTLSFVVKQTLFKGIASREFRKFKIEKDNLEIPVKAVEVIDLIEISPFDSASETSIISLKKGEETSYPVPYKLWHKASKIGIKSDDPLEIVQLKVEIEDLIAVPDPDEDDLLAPWIVYNPAVPILSMGKGNSAYKARHGIVNDLNNVFFVIPKGVKGNNRLTIENNPKLGRRKKVSPFTGEMEPDLIYPVIKADSLIKWGLTNYHYMVVPQQKVGGNNEAWLKENYPKTYEYLKYYKQDLDGRASKWFKGEDKPFYALFGIGEYSFAPYKISWCCMSFKPDFSVISSIKDEYVGMKQILPDNVMGYISVDSADEAHFICGVLNSSLVGDYLKSRSSKSKWGISIDRVNKVPVPLFDPQNAIHKKISLLSQHLHHLVFEDVENPTIQTKEQELNQIVSELFQVSQTEQIQSEKPKKIDKFIIYPIDIPKNLQDSPLISTNTDNLTYNILDIETTGFSFPSGDRIVEIWVGKFQKGKLVKEYHSLINPDRKIPQSVTDYHGISNKMVKASPKIDDVADSLVEFLNDGIIICHNSKFDLHFLYGELANCRSSIPQIITLDTLLLARLQFSFGRNDLKSIAQTLKLDIDDNSKAKKDAYVTAMFFFWMVDRFKVSLGDITLKQLICLQARFISL
jgi:DNA polymerase III epsilon subunit family exonuclease